MKDKIYKSKYNKVIFGVCAGIAQYFEIDPSLVRIITALLLIVGSGFIIPLYLILAIVLPQNPAEKKENVAKKDSNTYFLGGGLMAVGAFMLLDSYNIINWNTLWPAILIIIGVVIIWGQNQKK